jgi:hypothetical protein
MRSPADYTKLKALAISVAEEVEFQFDCTDIPLTNASKSDLHLINISIDDEGHEEDGRDWTSQMGLNLKYCANLRKERSEDQGEPPLSLWKLFSNKAPTSDVPNLKWLCRKTRTPYKVIGAISSSSATTAAAKVEPDDTKPKTDSFGNVYEEKNSQGTLQQCSPMQSSRLQGSDEIALHTEEDHNKHCLVDIPIVLDEHPMMHQVCEGPVSVKTCDQAIYSPVSQDSVPLADSPVELVRDQEYVQSTEQSSSTSVSVQQFFDDGSISMEGSMNCLNSHEYLESQNATLGCRNEQLQVDTSHSFVKSVELEIISPSKSKHESPQKEQAQTALVTAIPAEDGECIHNGSNNFDILLGALAEETNAADAPMKNEVGNASLTLMTLSSNDQSSAEVTEGKFVEMAKRDTISGLTVHGQQVVQSRDFQLSDLMSRSIGRSSRTDIICYVRRKHKRKRESKSITDTSHSVGSFARSPCESLRPRTRPAVVEDKMTMEAPTVRKGKITKMGLFQCDIDLCGMKFETRAELNAHKRNICTDESCGKRFSSHKYLKRHQVVHSEVRPLKCPWDGCGMTFKWLWAQTEHVRVHTGERPYNCSAPNCGQTFRYVSDYSRHRKKFNHY